MHFDLLLSDSASQICCCVRDIIKAYAAARSTKLSFPGLLPTADYGFCSGEQDLGMDSVSYHMGHGSPRATNIGNLLFEVLS